MIYFPISGGDGDGSSHSHVHAAKAMTLVMAFNGYNGTPRLGGMNDQPAMNLGANPAVKYAGMRADCTWYARENFHNPREETANCSNFLWSALSRDVNLATLEGFTYYTPVNQPKFYDRTYQEYFCLVGCFNLAATASPALNASLEARSAPPVNVPPAGVTLAAITAVPPPSPAKMAPPATLFRSPPSGLPRAPPSIATSPISTACTPRMQAPGPVPTQTSAGVNPIRHTFRTSLLILIAALRF